MCLAEIERPHLMEAVLRTPYGHLLLSFFVIGREGSDKPSTMTISRTGVTGHRDIYLECPLSVCLPAVVVQVQYYAVCRVDTAFSVRISGQPQLRVSNKAGRGGSHWATSLPGLLKRGKGCTLHTISRLMSLWAPTWHPAPTPADTNHGLLLQAWLAGSLERRRWESRAGTFLA